MLLRYLALIVLAASSLLSGCSETPEPLRDSNLAAGADSTAEPGRRTPFGTEFGPIPIADLRTGDCFNAASDTLEPHEVLLVPCSGRWEYRVLNAVLLDRSGGWPGFDYIDREAALRCDGDTVSIIFPSEDSWFLGDRTLLCMGGPP